MGQKIPSGLVIMPQTIPDEFTGQELLERSVIRKLWQAFSVSHRASQKEVDQRLEYLFWRIWSRDDLLCRISVKALDRLVSRIMASTSIAPQALPQNIPSLPRVISPSTIGHSHSKSHPTGGQHRLHPILKKPATAPTETQKSTRLLLEKPEGGNITCNPSTPPTLIMSDTHAKDTPVARPGLKKSYSAATRSARGTRRRPVFNRRRSSQASVSKSSLSGPRLTETKPIQKPGRRSSTNDEQDPIPSKQKSKTERALDDVEADLVPFPIEISPPIPQHPSDMTLADPALIADLPSAPPKTNVTSTVVSISEKQDPGLSQELETVSQDPMPQDKGKQRAEPMDSSCSEAEYPEPIMKETDVPGFPGAKRIPMPKEMEKRLLHLLTDDNSPEEKIPLPDGPCISAERVWLPVYPKAYLEDWMLQDETCSSAPQPSSKPLVAEGFRKRFAMQLEADMEAMRMEEEATQGLDVLAVHGTEEQFDEVRVNPGDADSDSPVPKSVSSSG